MGRIPKQVCIFFFKSSSKKTTPQAKSIQKGSSTALPWKWTTVLGINFRHWTSGFVTDHCIGGSHQGRLLLIHFFGSIKRKNSQQLCSPSKASVSFTCYTRYDSYLYDGMFRTDRNLTSMCFLSTLFLGYEKNDLGIYVWQSTIGFNNGMHDSVCHLDVL